MKTLGLQRHLLGSIDLSDVDEEMNESERKEYVAAISAVFPRLEKDIKKFLYQQLMYSSNQAENWEQVIFGRGTFNGLSLLLEYWKTINQEQLEKSIPKQQFDANVPIGEIGD